MMRDSVAKIGDLGCATTVKPKPELPTIAEKKVEEGMQKVHSQPGPKESDKKADDGALVPEKDQML